MNNPKAFAHGRITKFGFLDVAEDGTLSLHGQTIFPAYSPNGNLEPKLFRYRLVIEEIDPANDQEFCIEGDCGNFAYGNSVYCHHHRIKHGLMR